MKKDKAPGIDVITTELLQGEEDRAVKAKHVLVTKTQLAVKKYRKSTNLRKNRR